MLLLGTIFQVDHAPGFGDGSGLFGANFLFRIDRDHPALGYTSHIGVWNCYMEIAGWPGWFDRYLFRRTWGPASAPLNSYIGQVSAVV